MLIVSYRFVYVGTTTGNMFAYDLKSLKSPLHTYKGFTGCIQNIGVHDNYVYACGLDRYVRIFNQASTHLVYQCYIKSKATQILLKDASKELMDQQKSVESFSESVVDQEYEALFEKMPTVR